MTKAEAERLAKQIGNWCAEERGTAAVTAPYLDRYICWRDCVWVLGFDGAMCAARAGAAAWARGETLEIDDWGVE